MIIENLGLPYMGSKRKLAPEIIRHILSKNPECKYFYDLFGGGGAISFIALQYPQINQVFYNELNTGVTELLKKIQREGITPEFYQWIDRETFNNNKNNNDWFGGLCKVIWSFGNNQITYLFGPDIENYKKNYHLVVIENKNKIPEMIEFIENYIFDKYGIKEKCILEMPKSKNYQDRRLEIRTQVVQHEKKCKLNQLSQLEQLQRLQQLEQLQRLQQLERLKQLQQLQQLQQLEGLERLRQLERLNITNLSYEQVEINTPINETIIYLDPPYKNTGQYQHIIDYDNLLNWINKSPYKIYLSSYEFEGLHECHIISHRSTLSPTNNSKNVKEKIYCNKPEIFARQMSFL